MLHADLIFTEPTMPTEICLPYLIHYGTESQKSKYLPKACSGDGIVAIAMTEPGAGSDLQGVSTTAVREGDEYVINGSKVCNNLLSLLSLLI